MAGLLWAPAGAAVPRALSAGDADDEGDHRLLVDRYLGTLDIGLARDVEQLLATQPSELHALTADLSAGETEALLRRLVDVHGERERAQSR